jgi:hypothetical protein
MSNPTPIVNHNHFAFHGPVSECSNLLDRSSIADHATATESLGIVYQTEGKYANQREFSFGYRLGRS